MKKPVNIAALTLTLGTLMILVIVGTFVWMNETAITTPTPPTAPTLVAKTPAPEPPPPIEGAAVLPSFHEPAASPESRESPTGTERRISRLEQRIDALEARTYNLASRLGLYRAQLETQEAGESTTRAATSRTVVGDDLKELNRNVIRLTTMVTMLVDQNRAEAETKTEAPTTDDTDHHDR